MPEIYRHRGQSDVHPLVAKRRNNVGKVVFVVAINACHARVIVRDTVIGEHLHAFPLEVLHRVSWPDALNEAVQGLPESCTL